MVLEMDAMPILGGFGAFCTGMSTNVDQWVAFLYGAFLHFAWRLADSTDLTEGLAEDVLGFGSHISFGAFRRRDVVLSAAVLETSTGYCSKSLTAPNSYRVYFGAFCQGMLGLENFLSTKHPRDWF